ncbi:AAA ATPase [Burkholderia sp. H160]|nr:AAA ATPase [Burkholderia sp. H160]
MNSTENTTDIHQALAEACAAAGVVPPARLPTDGQFHRASVAGVKNGQGDASIKLFADGEGGIVHNWRTGESRPFFVANGHELTEAERVEGDRRINAVRREAEAERARCAKDAAAKALAIWSAATPARDDHPYLARKRVHAVETLREIVIKKLTALTGYPPKSKGERLQGRVLVAPVHIDGKLSTVELIDGAGRKSALSGGVKGNGFWSVAPVAADASRIVICEGAATGLSLHECTGAAVVAALSCHNLLDVARTMRTQHPGADLIVAGDIGNGADKARKAAREAGAKLVYPDFGAAPHDGLTDFNDLHQARGADVVRAQIEAATAEAKAEAAPVRVLLTRASDVKPESIRWLWSDWLPVGKVVLLAGAPGAGKTTIALDLAATISRGGAWPDGSRCEVGGVLIWSGEDSAADVIVPRLLAAGADLDRVHIITGRTDDDGTILPFDPAADVPLLGERLAGIGGAALLIVDPLVSAVAGDAHRANDVRRDLQAFVDLAASYQVTVLGITHFSKRSAGALPAERVIGSQAFVALARTVLVAARDEGSERRILARAKSNIAPDDGGFAYTMEQKTIDGGIRASHIGWGESIEGSARALLADVEQVPDDDERSEQDEAAGFLRDLLAAAPVPVKSVQADARGAGYSWRTIERAKRDLGIEARKIGLKEGWVWALPEGRQAEGRHEDRRTKNVGGLRDDWRSSPTTRVCDPPLYPEDRHFSEDRQAKHCGGLPDTADDVRPSDDDEYRDAV